MKRKPYRFFLYILLNILRVIIVLLPYRTAVFLGAFFGRIAYRILPKYRNIALQNLEWAFRGQKDEREIEQISLTFARILGAMYHSRIKYPEKKNDDNRNQKSTEENTSGSLPGNEDNKNDS